MASPEVIRAVAASLAPADRAVARRAVPELAEALPASEVPAVGALFSEAGRGGAAAAAAPLGGIAHEACGREGAFRDFALSSSGATVVLAYAASATRRRPGGPADAIQLVGPWEAAAADDGHVLFGCGALWRPDGTVERSEFPTGSLLAADGDLLAAALPDGTVLAYERGEKRADARAPGAPGGYVEDVAARAGRVALLRHLDGNVREVTLAFGGPRFEFEGGDARDDALTLFDDRARVVSGGEAVDLFFDGRGERRFSIAAFARPGCRPAWIDPDTAAYVAARPAGALVVARRGPDGAWATRCADEVGREWSPFFGATYARACERGGSIVLVGPRGDPSRDGAETRRVVAIPWNAIRAATE